MRHVLTLALLVLVISGVALVVLRQSNPLRPSRPLLPPGAKAVPYTVTLRSTVTTRKGEIHEHSPETLAMRSDGATARVFHDGVGPVRQLKFGNGLVVELKDGVHGKSTIYRPIAHSWILDPSQDCARNVFHEDSSALLTGRGAVTMEVIAGYRAARYTAGDTTRWLAPDHGCALIRQSRVIPTGQVSLLELVRLVPGEPDQALFDIPATYQEGAPSTFMRPLADQCRNERCRQDHSNYRAVLDKNYFEERAGETVALRK
jgi:hypothetical protein